MVNYYFITKGFGNGIQFYTPVWRRSELFLNPIKPIIVEFIEDPHNKGNWFQFDRDRPAILPKWFGEGTKPLDVKGFLFNDVEKYVKERGL